MPDKGLIVYTANQVYMSINKLYISARQTIFRFINSKDCKRKIYYNHNRLDDNSPVYPAVLKIGIKFAT